MGQAMDIWDILGMLASFAFFAGLSAFTWLAYSRTFELNQRVMNTFAPGASAALMEHAVDRGADVREADMLLKSESGTISIEQLE